MKFELAKRHAGATAGFLIWLLVSACASPPQAPVAEAKVVSRTERVVASLAAMNFEKRDDGWHLTLPAPLVFPFDSDVVAATVRDNLISVGRELRELGIDQVLVRGHTDNVGTREYNLSLSKRRADAVARVLTEGGYPADKIDPKGLGFSMPIADNGTAEGRAQNRRVVIIVQAI
jgi:outer membrane protein OmpA-like peptidoglycan-associated protein